MRTTACKTGGQFLPREAGEGDRRRRWRGRPHCTAPVSAPSTMLRMVPLPRRKRRGRSLIIAGAGAWLTWLL